MTAGDRKRLRYYAWQLPVMLGDSFTLWRGYRLRVAERYRLTLLCAFTPLLDDWFDAEALPVKDIMNRIYHPSDFEPATEKDMIAQQLLLALHRVTPRELPWQAIAERLLTAQDMRRNGEGDAAQITREMGGQSVLLARILIDPSPDGAEREAIEMLGYGVQLLDDIFDVYEDTNAGLKTLPVTCGHIDHLQSEYTSVMREISRLFGTVKTSPRHRRRFLSFWWSFFARAYVSLQQLKEVEVARGGIFDPAKCQRKELICDMETFRGVSRFIVNYFRFQHYLR